MPRGTKMKQKQDQSSEGAKKAIVAGRSQVLLPVDPGENALESKQILSLCDVVCEDSKWVDLRSNCLNFLCTSPEPRMAFIRSKNLGYLGLNAR